MMVDIVSTVIEVPESILDAVQAILDKDKTLDFSQVFIAAMTAYLTAKQVVACE